MPDIKEKVNAKPVDKKPQGLRFDHQLYELLGKNDGAFIGEYHEFPALRQSLTYLAPAMKARGITTVSIELSQSDIDDMRKAKTADEFLKKTMLSIDKRKRPEEWYHLVQAYDKLGIKVFGHEEDAETQVKRKMDGFQKKLKALVEEPLKKATVKIEADAKKIDDPKEREKFTKAETEKIKTTLLESKEVKALITSLTDNADRRETLAARNKFAADYIKKNRAPGKILVIGGAAHSHHWDDAPESLDKPGEKEGLDKRLAIPAINTQHFERMGGLTGETRVLVPGKAYEVALPVDLKQVLKEHKITSWPPPKGAPVVEPYNIEKPKFIPPVMPMGKPSAIPGK